MAPVGSGSLDASGLGSAVGVDVGDGLGGADEGRADGDGASDRPATGEGEVDLYVPVAG